MKRLAVSNIAWQPEQQAQALAILRDRGVSGLEIAPGLTFATSNDPFVPDPDALTAFSRTLAEFTLVPVSMQSLLYGVTGAQLFGSAEERRAFRTGITRAIDLAERLHIPNIVLGSPANRIIPAPLEHGAAQTIADETFASLGDYCATREVYLALEPNPAAYNTNFMNTVEDTEAVVRRVGHPHVTLNFDLGAVATNGQSTSVASLVGRVYDIISHVHISAPYLAPAPHDKDLLACAAKRLTAAGYAGWYSIEMKNVSGDDTLAAVRDAIARAHAALDAAERLPA
jgi:sugar phosphate isomerase/epimerase